MKQEAVSPAGPIRRCSNCGTRVAQNAETCYFCGHDLKKDPKARRITWLDLLLVIALLAVVAFWWRMASDSDQPLSEPAPAQVVSPEVTVGQPSPALASPEEDGQDQQSANGAEQPVASIPEPVELSQSLVVKHKVQTGETLVGIAGSYGVTVEDIQAANNLESALIRAGDELLIPVPEGVVAGDGNPTVSYVFRYEVQPGDTIVSIAVRFGTQVNTILAANSLGPNDVIRPTQILLVPVEQVPTAVVASSEAAQGTAGSGVSLYGAPRLIGPQDRETIAGDEEVFFRWLSVELLAPNEWYVLHIWPQQGVQELPPPVWTKATSYRLDTEWAPAGGSATYGWQVSVIRVLPDAEGRTIQMASAPSDVRTFTWQ